MDEVEARGSDGAVTCLHTSRVVIRCGDDPGVLHVSCTDCWSLGDASFRAVYENPRLGMETPLLMKESLAYRD